MLRAHSALTKLLDAELVREHGLPLSSYEVLLFLADSPQGQMRMSELADGVLLSRSGLTRRVDRMERDGLLCREPSEDDARGWFAVITPEGPAAVQPRPQDSPRRCARPLPLSLLTRRAARARGALEEALSRRYAGLARLVMYAPASTSAVPSSAATWIRSSFRAAPRTMATMGTK